MQQPETLFRLGTDAVLLADFAAVQRQGAVCDLCAGTGAVGLMLLAKAPRLRVTAVELQAEACAAVQKNLEENGLHGQLRVLQGDVRQIDRLLGAGGFDDVVCNPPYYPVGTGRQAQDPALAVARTELCCTLEDVCRAGAWLLKTGGAFWLVHLPGRLSDVFCTLRAHRLEPKQLRLVCHSAAHAPSLVLVKAVKGGGVGLDVLPALLLHAADGSQSAEYRRIYHL